MGSLMKKIAYFAYMVLSLGASTAYTMQKPIQSVSSYILTKGARSLQKTLGTTAHITCTSLGVQMALRTMLAGKVSIQPQFENRDKPNAFYAILIAPALEELIFTYGISNILGPRYGPIITPILFASLHDHTDMKTRILLFVGAVLNSYLRISNYHSQSQAALAPLLSHMLQNALSIYINSHS
jgi:hypothetical protein